MRQLYLSQTAQASSLTNDKEKNNDDHNNKKYANPPSNFQKKTPTYLSILITYMNEVFFFFSVVFIAETERSQN